MTPANKRLKSTELTRAELSDRLVGEFEFVVCQCVAQILFQFMPPLHLRIHLRFEKAEDPATVGLGPVQCQIAILDQPLRYQAVIGRYADTDTRSNDHLMTVDLVGSTKCLDRALSQ